MKKRKMRKRKGIECKTSLEIFSETERRLSGRKEQTGRFRTCNLQHCIGGDLEVSSGPDGSGMRRWDAMRGKGKGGGEVGGRRI